jgi:hypothetical protein
MSAIIEATTEAKSSNPFVVNRGETVGVKAFGLAGSETAVIKTLASNGQWQDVLDVSGTLTATAYQSRIQASGIYCVTKSATAGLAGVDID